MEEDVYTLPSGITYLGEGWKRFAEDLGFNSAEDYADYIATNLNLASGEMVMERRYFEVVGTLNNGKRIVIKQSGEFDMYGGPYLPKMQKPTILIDGEDFYEAAKYDVENLGIGIEPGSYFDALVLIGDAYAGHIALAVEGISPNRILDALAERGITSPLLRKSFLAEIRMGMY